MSNCLVTCAIMSLGVCGRVSVGVPLGGCGRVSVGVPEHKDPPQ